MNANHKVYILNFSFGANLNQDLLTKIEYILRYHPDILGYWNYIPLVYCFKSRLHSAALRSLLWPLLQTQFMLAELRPENIDGNLPQAAWEWFYAPPDDRSPAERGAPGMLGYGQGLLGALGSKKSSVFD